MACLWASIGYVFGAAGGVVRVLYFLPGLEGYFIEYPLHKVRNGMWVFELFGAVYRRCYGWIMVRGRCGG